VWGKKNHPAKGEKVNRIGRKDPGSKKHKDPKEKGERVESSLRKWGNWRQ